MANSVKTLVQNYGRLHLGLGLIGKMLFVLGSIPFLVGALGRLPVELWRKEQQ